MSSVGGGGGPEGRARQPRVIIKDARAGQHAAALPKKGVGERGRGRAGDWMGSSDTTHTERKGCSLVSAAVLLSDPPPHRSSPVFPSPSVWSFSASHPHQSEDELLYFLSECLVSEVEFEGMT